MYLIRKIKHILKYYLSILRNDDFIEYQSFPFDTNQQMPDGAEKVMQRCCNIIKSLNINYRITDGTVLGLYRGGEFIAHDNDIDILIVDKFDYNTKKFVKHMHKIIKTVVIPDVNKIDYDADLVINGFIGYKNQIRKNRFGSKCVLGPRYQIIHKNYEKKISPKKKKYTILATFGGFDENNLFDIFCQNLENHLEQIKVKIILGPVTKKSKILKKLELKYSKNLFVVNETKNMRKEISETSFGFCAGGITTYEFATMNIPFAIICQYKHQLLTAKAWEKRKIAYNLGLPSNNSNIKIQKILNKIFSGDVNLDNYKGHNIVDGLGSKRAADQILKLFE